MKKNIFLILVFMLVLSSVSFAQEYTYNPENKSILNPVFSIFTRLEGRSSEVAGNALLTTSGMEFMLGAPSWTGRFYFYGQLRYSYIASGDGEIALRTAGNIISYSPSSIGALGGFGGYLFDNRDADGKGFSLTMNGAIGLDFALVSSIVDTSDGLFSLLTTSPAALANMYRIPIELNTYFRYALNSKFAVQVGINLGIDTAFHYVESETSIESYPAFRYGLSIGLAF